MMEREREHMLNTPQQLMFNQMFNKIHKQMPQQQYATTICNQICHKYAKLQTNMQQQYATTNATTANVQPNINMELINHLNDNVEQFNIIMEELSLLRTQVNNKHNYLQLEINKNKDEYIYKFKEINNVVGVKLISYSLPEQSYNFNNSNIEFTINGFKRSIRLEKGFYNINTLIMKLNENDSLHFSINYKKRLCVSNKTNNVSNDGELIMVNNFTFEENDTIRKLGFTNLVSNNGILEATNIVDFRNDTKLKLFLNNIDSKLPFGILNFNGTSLCEFNFKKSN